jgi:hypothetical protein
MPLKGCIETQDAGTLDFDTAFGHSISVFPAVYESDR